MSGRKNKAVKNSLVVVGSDHKHGSYNQGYTPGNKMITPVAGEKRKKNQISPKSGMNRIGIFLIFKTYKWTDFRQF
jgi:hypothetical protein